MGDFILYALLGGGFLISLVVAVSYFWSRRFNWKSKAVLGSACLVPLVSMALLIGGLYVSGSQFLATLPCIVAAVFFAPALLFGSPPAFLRSPTRGTIGLVAIGWSGAASCLSSHYCFLGACC